jgi:hypothetical protein
MHVSRLMIKEKILKKMTKLGALIQLMLQRLRQEPVEWERMA